jgi:anionic cell wall polymer biosynthesis LytR-Cps2A-Psr (LCP) family protein
MEMQRAVAPVVPPDIPPVVMAPPVSRRQARQQQRRQEHRRVGLLGGTVIAVAALVVAGALGLFAHHHYAPHHSAPKRTQTTLLMQIQAANRTAGASVLLANNAATKTGVEVLVPEHLITAVCGYGQQDFGNILTLPNGAAASQQAMSQMLNGVTIDGSWVVTEAQLAKLIDVFGGVTVDVDVNVVQRTSHGGGKILIPAGSSERLQGTQAVEYALYDASARAGAAGEQARMSRVLTAMFQALPTNPQPIAAALRTLGSGAGSTLGVTRLATMLAGLAADSRSQAGVFPTDLPVTAIDAGGAAPSYSANGSSSAIHQLVQSQLADSVPASASAKHPSVYLLNGVGTPGLVLSACSRLSSNGFAFAGSGNAGSFNNKTSSVEIQSDSQIALGDQIAHALGLPTSDVVRSNENQNVADFLVILGADYHS